MFSAHDFVLDRPCLVIHGLDQAIAVLTVAAETGVGVALLSAPGAALAGGCGWWHALCRQARAAVPAADAIDILDCAEAPGAAMAALRQGQRLLVLDGACPGFGAVSAAAATLGGVVLPIRPAALDMASRGASHRLAAHLLAAACR
jgi:hypothetical protein